MARPGEACRHWLHRNSKDIDVPLRNLCAKLILVALCAVPAARATDLVAKSGPELYQQFCASCHGSKGRGDGPVAGSLGVEVPDLTRLAIRQGGFFDRERVERIIDGRQIIAAHGRRTMPIWGEAFSRSHLGDPDAERAARTLVTRVADYLWQLQQPVVSRGGEKQP
jgi:mono/diheme cytochrome c family protein